MNLRTVCFCGWLYLLPAVGQGQTDLYEYPHALYNPTSGAITFRNLDNLATGNRWINLYSNNGRLIALNTEEFGKRQAMDSSILTWWIPAGISVDSTIYAGNVVVPGTPLSDLSMNYSFLSGGFSTIRGFDFPRMAVIPGSIFQIPEPSTLAILFALAVSLPRRLPRC